MLLLLACATEYTLDAVPPGYEDLPAEIAAVASGDVPLTPTRVDRSRSAAIQAETDPTGVVRRASFVIGGQSYTPVVDILFVLDGSASMHRVVSRIQAAFADLVKDDAFPAGARIGVMSTIPGEPGALDVPHAAVNHPNRNRHDPGFLRLVRAETLEDFLAVAPDKQAARFPATGCDTSWFAPGALNADGVPCMVAHTAISMDAVGVEAGLSALDQLLEKRGNRRLFRSGAAVDVVFVSDTHDPGLPEDHPYFEELVAARPDAAQLADRVDEANTVASFRIHAIAPATRCGEPWEHIGPAYLDAAEATGGATLDVCTAEDYGPIARAIAHDGAILERPVLALGEPAAAAYVTIDGEPVGHSLSPDGQAVVLDATVGRAQKRVTVTYTVAR